MTNTNEPEAQHAEIPVSRPTTLTHDRHPIDPVPESARHGKPRDLFTFWFALSAAPVTVAVAAVAVRLKLPIWQALLAFIVGAAIGSVLMAYHSAQGPRLGLPQMIQSRAQFGFYGGLVPNAAALLTYFIYFVLGSVVVGDGIAGLWHISLAQALSLASFLAWVVATFGYRLIHVAYRLVTVVMIVLFVAFAIRIFQQVPHSHYVAQSSTSAFFLVLTLGVSFQLTYSPFVSDYSRYLPSRTSTSRVFWATWTGNTIGFVLFIVVGLYASILNIDAVSANVIGFLAGLYPAVTAFLTLVMIVVLVLGNVSNLYSAFETGYASLSESGSTIPAVVIRAVACGGFAAGGGYVAAVISGSFLTDLSNFLNFLLYLLAPWSAINLVDFYLVRKGHYDVRDLTRRAGRYGLVNWPTLLIFAVSVLVQLPFVESEYPAFTGFWASSLHGVNVSWLIGFVVAGTAYHLVNRGGTRKGGNRYPESRPAGTDGGRVVSEL